MKYVIDLLFALLALPFIFVFITLLLIMVDLCLDFYFGFGSHVIGKFFQHLLGAQ